LSDPDHQHAIDEAIWEELETGLRHQGRITSNYPSSWRSAASSPQRAFWPSRLLPSLPTSRRRS
jgi:hypothetical protein